MSAAGTKGADRTLSQTELQEGVQRFAGVFSDRVTQAVEAICAGAPHLAQHALRRNLLYVSAALDIASGPSPEQNLLDMVVFVTLSGQLVDRYWVPEQFGTSGQPLAAAFERSEQDLWRLARRIMAESQKLELQRLIREWHDANPEMRRVEWVRLSDFSGVGEDLAVEPAKVARGLLASVKAATQTADQALLLAERAMYLTHRLPFLLRLQARLAAREILSDTIETLAKAQHDYDLGSLVGQLAAIAGNAASAARDSRELTQSLAPILPDARRALVAAALVAEQAVILTRQLAAFIIDGPRTALRAAHKYAARLHRTCIGA